MKEELISLETAKLAKEKGFNEVCQYGFNEKIQERIEMYNFNKENLLISSPSQCLLAKWLREKHNIKVEILFIPSMDDLKEWYLWNIYDKDADESFNMLEKAMDDSYQNVGRHYINPDKFKKAIKKYAGGFTYEEAFEKGLQQALNLI